MSPEKTTLIESIRQSRQAMQTVIDTLQPDTIVYPDSGWTVKDLLAHLTMWEIHYTKAIEAFNLGNDPYLIPNFTHDNLDEFNQAQYGLHKDDILDDVIENWKVAREDFLAAITAIADDKMNERLPAPANPEMSPRLITLITFAAGHEKWHMDEMSAITA